jgi:nitroimidazol reductase NimA-like FMN-containing flavoprotein (pyridoxamine 5'-phosphate oxidase superfamily)
MAGEDGGRARVRRKDRARDEPWIQEFLTQARWGVLALVDDLGRPFANSNLFVFDRDRRAVYLHTARVGATPGLLAAPRAACFSASEMGRLLPADEALEFSVEYAGVTVFGTAHTVHDSEEARKALQLLLDKYAPHLTPGSDYRGISPEELKRTAVYRLDIEEWSGKAKLADPDFPGAFHVPPPPVLPPAFRGDSAAVGEPGTAVESPGEEGAPASPEGDRD